MRTRPNQPVAVNDQIIRRREGKDVLLKRDRVSEESFFFRRIFFNDTVASAKPSRPLILVIIQQALPRKLIFPQNHRYYNYLLIPHDILSR